MIIVTAQTYVTTESRAAFEELTAKTISDSLAEDGCIAYSCAASLEDEGTYHWFECWRDEAAFTAHWDSAHHQNYLADIASGARVTRTRPAVGHFFRATETDLDSVLVRA